MAPIAHTHENPIILKTHKAARVLGCLIARWSKDPTTIPDFAVFETDDRVAVMDTGPFLKFLAGLSNGDGLNHEDIGFRDGVEQIELVLPHRSQTRATLVLPEGSAVEFQEDMIDQFQRINIVMPHLYRQILEDPNTAAHSIVHLTAVPDTDESGYLMSVLKDDNEPSAQDPMDLFLYPYLATYVCAQCT